MDHLSWHTNPDMKERMARMALPLSFSGPYAFQTAPIELLFSFLKLGDLNPARLPTGKK